MNIDTMQDIIDNIELLKQREITYYEGHWCCYKVDQNGCGSVDNDIRLNEKMGTLYHTVLLLNSSLVVSLIKLLQLN